MVHLTIKEICKSRGIAVNELAKMIDITPPNLYNIVSGKQRPSLETIEKIASALDVEVSELFAPSGAPKIVCPHCGKLISIRAENANHPGGQHQREQDEEVSV